MIYQLPEMIPVDTPFGPGYAVLIEAGQHDHFWTVILGNGALVTFTQDRILVQRSYTHRRGMDDATMAKVMAGVRPGS